MLDAEYAAKLTPLAERMHIQEGTLAKSLLSTALDSADPREGLEQARRGEGVSLDDLA